MTAKDNPYRPPSHGGAESGPAPRAPAEPFRLAAKVFPAWIVGASLVSGAAIAWQTAYALAAFSAEARTVGLVALSALRTGAAQVSAAAAGVALVAGTHHRSAAGAELRVAWPPWRLYALVPLAWPVSAGLMVGAGTLVAVAYDVGAATSLHGALALVEPIDPIVGLLCASLDALLLGALAAVALPRLAGAKAGVAVKVVVALVTTGVVGGAVTWVLGAFFDDGR